MKTRATREEARDRSVVIGAMLFWTAIFLVIVLRDPMWRMFYEGRIVSAAPTATGWLALNADSLQALARAPVDPGTGVTDVEDAFRAAVIAQRDALPAAEPARSPLVASDSLRTLARARAAARLTAAAAGANAPVELRYPDVSVALAMPTRLLRVAEIAQVLHRPLDPGSSLPRETVGGWMNQLEFATALAEPAHLELGVGAVPGAQPGSGPSVDAFLVEVFAELDKPLPAVTSSATPLTFSGRRVGDEDLPLFIKGPADASFVPLAAQWSQGTFTATLDWKQGPGLYAIRAQRGRRISDARPVLAQ